MESNEAPKVPGVENKELEQKARELAIATKEKGMGMLFGKFPFRLLPANTNTLRQKEFTTLGKFIQGEEGASLVSCKTPVDLQQINPERQIWIRNKYIPPMEKVMVDEVQEIKGKRLGILPKTDRISKKVLKPTNNPVTYHGKKGEFDWVQFDYYMPAYHALDIRPGTYVNMSIAVPSDIAEQIDEQVKKNVYFPDAFFKALYPGYIGPDKKQNITRPQAKELQIIDNGSKGGYKSEILQYPQPIPF